MTLESIQEILIERNIKRASLQDSNFRKGNRDDSQKGRNLASESKEDKDFDVEESVAVERKFDSD